MARRARRGDLPAARDCGAGCTPTWPSSKDEKSAGWDGLSILSFDSREALDAALASEEWQAAVAHVGAMRGRRMIFTGDEQTMVSLQQDA